MEGLTEGRIVHYVITPEIHRAAIVVNVVDKKRGIIDLFVFSIPSDNRGGFFMNLLTLYNETKEPDSWHWIEKA